MMTTLNKKVFSKLFINVAVFLFKNKKKSKAQNYYESYVPTQKSNRCIQKRLNSKKVSSEACLS